MKWKDKCPDCGGELTCYEMKKHLVWSRTCNECEYTDPRNYYDRGDGTPFALLTKKEAIEQGYLVPCQRCGEYETIWWMNQSDQCFKCNFKDKLKDLLE